MSSPITAQSMVRRLSTFQSKLEDPKQAEPSALNQEMQSIAASAKSFIDQTHSQDRALHSAVKQLDLLNLDTADIATVRSTVQKVYDLFLKRLPPQKPSALLNAAKASTNATTTTVAAASPPPLSISIPEQQQTPAERTSEQEMQLAKLLEMDNIDDINEALSTSFNEEVFTNFILQGNDQKNISLDDLVKIALTWTPEIEDPQQQIAIYTHLAMALVENSGGSPFIIKGFIDQLPEGKVSDYVKKAVIEQLKEKKLLSKSSLLMAARTLANNIDDPLIKHNAKCILEGRLDELVPEEPLIKSLRLSSPSSSTPSSSTLSGRETPRTFEEESAAKRIQTVFQSFKSRSAQNFQRQQEAAQKRTQLLGRTGRQETVLYTRDVTGRQELSQVTDKLQEHTTLSIRSIRSMKDSDDKELLRDNHRVTNLTKDRFLSASHQQARLPNLRFKVVTDDQGNLQGSMVTSMREKRVGTSEQGEVVELPLYIETISTAPWNIKLKEETGVVVQGEERRVEGAGTALIESAIYESKKQGKQGAVALEALPAAVGFYQKLGFVEDPSWKAKGGDGLVPMILTPDAAETFLTSQRAGRAFPT